MIGIASVMTDVVSVRKEGSSFICTNIVGESSTLNDVTMVEIDLLRHRIIFERS